MANQEHSETIEKKPENKQPWPQESPELTDQDLENLSGGLLKDIEKKL
jgi:hypothetical protein